MGRSHVIGHWRMDGVYGVLIGEFNDIHHLQNGTFAYSIVRTKGLAAFYTTHLRKEVPSM